MGPVSRDTSRPPRGGRIHGSPFFGSRFSMPDFDILVLDPDSRYLFLGYDSLAPWPMSDSGFIQSASFSRVLSPWTRIALSDIFYVEYCQEPESLEASENRPRGRPPLYSPGTPPRMFGVHINMSPDLWEAVRKHAEAIGEPSLSHVARKLLRERLTQLGYLKGPLEFIP